MTFESWDDAMFWHGSLIGYVAGVKAASKDEKKSKLLLEMADIQAKLESVESDNAKLRELVATYEGTPQEDVIDYLRQECIDWEDRYRTLAAENDKLRELVKDMHRAFFRLDIDHCQACPRDTINGPCTKFLVGLPDECSFEGDMRELGVEDE